MQYKQIFKLLKVPRYEGDNADSKIGENLKFQAAFWNALRMTMVRCSMSCIELRFMANPKSQGLDVYVITRSDENDSWMKPNVVSRLLPHDYRWQILGRQEQLDSSLGWPKLEYAYRLVRRVEFFNLPDRSGRWLNVESGNASAEPSDTGVSQSDGSRYGEERIIPEFRVRGMARQYREGTLCLPMLGALHDFGEDRNRLCEELQAVAPAVISLAIHPVEDACLLEDRVRADFLRRWLEPMSFDLRRSEFDMLREVAPNFERYWHSTDRLCNLTLRVAAADEGCAQSLAYWFACQLGGSSVFEVIPIARGKLAIDDLALPQDGSLADRFDSWLASNGVYPSEDYLLFLRRMPHLYTLDEAHKVMQLPVARQAGLAGIESFLIPPFYRSAGAVYEHPPQSHIRLGSPPAKLESSFPAAGFHTLHKSNLTRHALIVGSTGSGKSVTTELLLRELDRTDTDFLIVEPVKTEYRDALSTAHLPLKKPLRVYNLEGTPEGDPDANFLAFDPMRLQLGVTVSRHIAYLKSCFCAAFPMSDVFSLILENGLYAYYRDDRSKGGCAFRRLTRGSPRTNFIQRNNKDEAYVFPSFETFSSYFLFKHLPETVGKKGSSEFASEVIEAFTRRFQNLRQGPLGVAFSKADQLVLQAESNAAAQWNPFLNSLDGRVVLELDGLTDNEQKSLLMAFLLTFLYEHRQAQDMLRREAVRKGEPCPDLPELAHVLVLEEAHRILPASTKGRSQETAGESAVERTVSLFVNMLAEIRAYRQGLVIVEQIPTKIASEAIKNTNLKLMLRLTSQDDRDFLGEAMSLNEEQKRFVTNLQIGQCIAFSDNLQFPFLLQIPPKDAWTNLFTGRD